MSERIASLLTETLCSSTCATGAIEAGSSLLMSKVALPSPMLR